MNPMINAGAIASTSLVGGKNAQEQWERILSSISTFVGRAVEVDEEVCRSESETGHRNRAIAWMLKNFGIIEGEPMAALENYFRQCSILVSCEDLAFMAATLANGGLHPVTGQRALPAEHVERVLSVMSTCGMYDYAGNWMYEVGLPAKSGVGGGVIAVLPGRFGIAVFSPRLDAKGNSVRGIAACRHISKDFNLHAFSSAGDSKMALGRVYSGADAPSRRQPSPELRAFLQAHAGEIKYLCLHGFIGVDGMEYVTRKMQEMSAHTYCYILDMNHVSGLTDSAARMLHQTRKILAESDMAVVFSRIHGKSAIVEPLDAALHHGEPGYIGFQDNDLAAEWCENHLFGHDPHIDVGTISFTASPLLENLSSEQTDRLAAISTIETFESGAQVICQGQSGDTRIFFIEQGSVSVLVPLEGGEHQRVGSYGPGMNFGEMVLLGQSVRSASVVADTSLRCRVVRAEALHALFEEMPSLKIHLLENLAKDIAAKLRRATQWISALA